MAKYFGTDGIRGRASTPPITPEIALKVGMAAGLVFKKGDHRNRVVIGKDTRLSGYMIENALALPTRYCRSRCRSSAPRRHRHPFYFGPVKLVQHCPAPHVQL